MIRNCLLLIGLLTLPGLTLALGLGKLDLNSALNEPFDARIELLSATVEELDSLKVILADSDAFERANMERPFILSQLKFEVREIEGGSDYIRIYSSQAIREPFLNFLLEISWSRGRLFREYTVLLDPPLYDPNSRRSTSLPSTTDSQRPVETTTSSDDDHVVVYDLDYSPDRIQSSSISSSPTITGTQYGPTKAGDTLWSIASAMRPNQSVSVQQVMNALYQANPDAFINNNINGLKKGQILNLPDIPSIESVGRQQALDLVRNQESLWNEMRGEMADEVSVRPESSAEMTDAATDSVTATESSAQTEDDPELRLLSAEDSGEGIDSASESQVMDTGDASANSVLSEEAITALEMENQELQSRLQESESIIDDLKRLIELKEDELAALQNQIASSDTSDQQVVEVETEESQPIEETVTEPEFEQESDSTEVYEEEVEAEMEAETEMEIEAEFEQEVDEEVTVAEEVEPQVDIAEPPVTSEQSAGLMGMVNQYLAPIQSFVMANITMVGGAIAAIVVAILGLVGYRKMQSGSGAETVELPDSALPDFDEDATEVSGSLDAFSNVDDDDEDDAELDITPTPVAPETEDDDATVVRSEEDDEVGDATAEDFAFDLGTEEAEEEDPLAEVNVFLAYEHFDQAEEFVKNAIDEQPDNLDFHSKLLEVYYAAGNKSGYEDAARAVHEKTGGTGEHWDMAVAMWSELSPNRALFEERAEGMDETIDAPADDDGGMVDIFSADGSSEEADADNETLDLSAGGSDVLDMTTTLSDTDGSEEVDESELMNTTLNMDSAEDEDEEEVLDFTASSTEEMLDVTAAAGIDETLSELDNTSTADSDDELLDITGGSDDEDLLDVSSTGLGGLANDGVEEDNLLDISGTGLSLDTSTEEIDENTDEAEQASEDSSDLLDISSELNMEQADPDEDLLDVTAASSIEEEIEVSVPMDEEDSEGSATSMDLELDGLDLDLPDEEDSDEIDMDSMADKADDTIERAMDSSNDDNVVEFDITAGGPSSDSDEDSDDTLIMDLSDDSDDDLGVELDLTATSGGSIDEDFAADLEPSAENELDEDLSIDLEVSDESSEEESGLEIDLADTSDLDIGEAESSDDSDSLDLDLEIDTTDSDDISLDTPDDSQTVELDVDIDSEALTTDSDEEIDLDLSIDGVDDEPESSIGEIDFDSTNTQSLSTELDTDLSLDDIEEASDELDMEGTVELPQGSVPGVGLDKGDDEDDEDKTVFVPKSPGSDEEQSLEDEVSTKLDLAKAYVELGDQDSAKSILDEIMQEGNDDQKQQAQELLNQVNS